MVFARIFFHALQNVSVYVEQYFIERRLASFTVKSRRYVDFSGLGYHIPPELAGKALEDYRAYMDGRGDTGGTGTDFLACGTPADDFCLGLCGHDESILRFPFFAFPILDDKTPADNCVTVRERDSMKQVRIPISELKGWLAERVAG